MKQPYLKKYGEVAHFQVFIVSGKHIRSYIDEEFTNFGQHYRFKFIPKNEFWIDKEYHHGNEIHYFIDHLLVENQLMAKGKTYDQAIAEADAAESKERKKSQLLQKYGNDLMPHLHEKLFKKYRGKLKVWLVNGELVRDKFFIDFTEGGHDLVYHFVPKNEVWIDSDLNPREMKFVLLHELHERNLMAKELKSRIVPSTKLYQIYSRAHHSASNLEYFYRHHPKGIDRKIREEIKLSR